VKASTSSSANFTHNFDNGWICSQEGGLQMKASAANNITLNTIGTVRNYR